MKLRTITKIWNWRILGMGWLLKVKPLILELDHHETNVQFIFQNAYEIGCDLLLHNLIFHLLV